MSSKRSRKVMKTVKIDDDVHAYMVLLSERYDTTLSDALRQFIKENAPDIVELQEQIQAMKQRHLHTGE